MQPSSWGSVFDCRVHDGGYPVGTSPSGKASSDADWDERGLQLESRLRVLSLGAIGGTIELALKLVEGFRAAS